MIRIIIIRKNMVILDTCTLQNPAGAKFRLNVTNGKKSRNEREKKSYGAFAYGTIPDDKKILSLEYFKHPE